MSWQTPINKRISNSQSNVPVSYTQTTKRVKTVSVSEFLASRDKYRDVSKQLSDLFDDINKMVRTSSQCAASAQINHNQHNHNKWHVKKADEQDDKTKILSCFSMLAQDNYNEIFATCLLPRPPLFVPICSLIVTL
jgi:uncharacterized protein (UPF0210 family)